MLLHFPAETPSKRGKSAINRQLAEKEANKEAEDRDDNHLYRTVFDFKAVPRL